MEQIQEFENEARNDLIEGRNAVMEALRAGRTIDKIFIAKGDVDNSGGIDSTDIFYTMLYIANVAVGNDGGLTAEQIAAADVDGNGTVDSTDSFYIMYYVALHGAGHNTSWEEVLAK